MYHLDSTRQPGSDVVSVEVYRFLIYIVKLRYQNAIVKDAMKTKNRAFMRNTYVTN